MRVCVACFKQLGLTLEGEGSFQLHALHVASQKSAKYSVLYEY